MPQSADPPPKPSLTSWFASWYATPADEGEHSTQGGGAESNRSLGNSSSAGGEVEAGQKSSRPTSPSSTRSADSRGSSRSQEGGSDHAVEGGGEGSEDKDDDEDEDIRLSESTRLKGYITFAVASAIHYESAEESQLQREQPIETGNPEVDDFFGNIGANNELVYPATSTQAAYAMSVSMITLIVSLFCIVVHFDRLTCLKKVWIKAFRPKSRIELGLLIGLNLWWIIAAFIITSTNGIAGAGKGHYNLYFSTWACLWTSFWTLERWLVAAGHSSVTSFMESWPNRAPAWIVMFICSIGAMLSILDLFINWDSFEDPFLLVKAPLYLMYRNVSKAEWQWLIFVPAFTIPLSAGFFLIELFRVTKSDRENSKSERENVFEGLCIALLTCFWIPSLFIATTPGGAASLVGNAYFFIWGTTIIVTETFLWWIRDWRKGVHDVMRMQKEEYRRAQLLVLKKHKEEADKASRVDDMPGDILLDGDTCTSDHRVTFVEGDVATRANEDIVGKGEGKS